MKKYKQNYNIYTLLTDKLINCVHYLITEKDNNECRLSGKFGIVLLVITFIIAMVLCSDGRADECACVTIENEAHCVYIISQESCNEKEILESY